MKTVTHALLALGFVGAMAVSTPVTTRAQGVHIYGPGFAVDVGHRAYPYRHHRYNRHYDDGYSSNYYPRHRYRTWNGCPPHYTIQDGVCKPYRGY